VSHQLRLPSNAELVRQRRAGQMMFYALDDHHVIRLFAQAHEHVQEKKGPVTVGRDDTGRVSSEDRRDLPGAER